MKKIVNSLAPKPVVSGGHGRNHVIYINNIRDKLIVGDLVEIDGVNGEVTKVDTYLSSKSEIKEITVKMDDGEETTFKRDVDKAALNHLSRIIPKYKEKDGKIMMLTGEGVRVLPTVVPFSKQVEKTEERIERIGEANSLASSAVRSMGNTAAALATGGISTIATNTLDTVNTEKKFRRMQKAIEKNRDDINMCCKIDPSRSLFDGEEGNIPLLIEGEEPEETEEPVEPEGPEGPEDPEGPEEQVRRSRPDPRINTRTFPKKYLEEISELDKGGGGKSRSRSNYRKKTKRRVKKNKRKVKKTKRINKKRINKKRSYRKQ